MVVMQGTEEDIDKAIALLAEKELLGQIRVIYEDITTTSKAKKTEREKYTNKFIEKYAKELELSEDRIRKVVDDVISKAKWIKEIEELDEDLEDER